MGKPNWFGLLSTLPFLSAASFAQDPPAAGGRAPAVSSTDLSAAEAQALILNFRVEVISDGSENYAKLTGVVARECLTGLSIQNSSQGDTRSAGLVGFRIQATQPALDCLRQQAELRSKGEGSKDLVKLGETFKAFSRLELDSAPASGKIGIISADPTDEAQPYKHSFLSGTPIEFKNGADRRKEAAELEEAARKEEITALSEQLAQCHDTREGIAEEREILAQLRDLGVKDKTVVDRQKSLTDREVSAIRSEIKSADAQELREVRERILEIARDRPTSKRSDEFAALLSEIAKRQVSFSGDQGSPDYAEAALTLEKAKGLKRVSPSNQAALKKLGFELKLKKVLDELRSGDPSLASGAQSDLRDLSKSLSEELRKACSGARGGPECTAMRQVAQIMNAQVPAAYNEGRVRYNQDQMDQWRDAMGMNNMLNQNPYGPPMGNLGMGGQNYMVGGLNWGGNPSTLNYNLNPTMNGVTPWAGPQGLTQFNSLGSFSSSPVGQFQNQLSGFNR
jgi:hypothetical protein